MWALVASLATAGGIHLAVGYEHDFVGLHGTFFMLTGAMQAIGAAIVARRPDGRVIRLIAVGSAALLVTWLVERRPGLGGGDALEPLATATAVAEVITVVATLRLLSRPIARRGRIPAVAALALGAFVALGSGAFADGGHSDHDHADDTVVSNATSQEPRREPEPLPVVLTAGHHGDSTADGHDDEGTAPHGH